MSSSPLKPSRQLKGNSYQLQVSAGEFGDGTGLYAKLPLAPWWASFCSFSLYAYLWCCGVAHLYRAVFGSPNTDKIKTDTVLLLLLYLCETIGAFALNCSTMYNWRQLDFGVHHLSYVIIVGSAVLFEDELVNVFHYTLPLDLMTSANEAVAASRALGGPRWTDVPNRFYLLVLMVFLVPTEASESLTALSFHRRSTRLYIISTFTLLAPIYHAFMVMPHCWKVVTRWWRAKLKGDDNSLKPAVATTGN